MGDIAGPTETQAQAPRRLLVQAEDQRTARDVRITAIAETRPLLLSPPTRLDPGTETFYRQVIATLTDAQVPTLVGGGYAFDYYTHLGRRTKDLDLFVRPDDFARALEVLSVRGYRIEGIFHWIGKVYCGADCVDLIHRALSGVPRVDDTWFEHAVPAELFGRPVLLCPVEELLWAKAFVMERERYDGADVAHLLLARGAQLDWARLLRRFDAHWPLLLSHLILFGFIYPTERWRVPEEVLHALLGRQQAQRSSDPGAGKLCQGTLLSWRQYLVDVEAWGYADARLRQGAMTPQQVTAWTDAFRHPEPPDRRAALGQSDDLQQRGAVACPGASSHDGRETVRPHGRCVVPGSRSRDIRCGRRRSACGPTRA